MLIVAPHQTKSRLVETKDLDRVARDAAEMQGIMDTLVAPHSPFVHGIFALAHSQVEDKDPLRFFVIHAKNEEMKGTWESNALVIVNPVITRHVQVAVDKLEGCVTFPGAKTSNVKRWNKIEVTFSELLMPPMVAPYALNTDRKLSLTSRLAQIFQHEIDHFDGKYVYQVNWDAAEKSRLQPIKSDER